jgi:integrase
MRTIFPQENGTFSKSRTDSAQNPPDSEAEAEADKVRFPKVIRNKKTKVEVTIYGKSKGGLPNGKGGLTKPYPFYRVCWRVDGQRRMQSFATYSGAKQKADELVSDLGKGSRVTALTPGQAIDALAAFERLDGYFQQTGVRVSLLACASEWCDCRIKLGDRALGEAVTGFLGSVASLTRKNISEAVEEFIASRKQRTKSASGERPQSPKYHYNRAIMLRRFAGAFPNTPVSDLSKDHLDAFFASLAEIKSKSRNRMPVTSGKARNHHRAAIRQFLDWAVRKDYLGITHRLNQADSMEREQDNTAPTLFYTPPEFKALLDAAEGPMRAMIAIGGLAGLRTEELLRLSWEDMRRVENHIEITADKAKTRQRRLVEITPTLAQWLVPFAGFTGKIWAGHEITFHQNLGRVAKKAVVQSARGKVPVARKKKNGLRHSFCTYHFALHSNENLTAAQAGNSPAMIHQRYKGLATRKEAEAWFAVPPECAANIIPLPAKVGSS